MTVICLIVHNDLVNICDIKIGYIAVLLGNICISNGGLVVRRYFRKVQHISLPFVTLRFGRLPHL